MYGLFLTGTLSKALWSTSLPPQKGLEFSESCFILGPPYSPNCPVSEDPMQIFVRWRNSWLTELMMPHIMITSTLWMFRHNEIVTILARDQEFLGWRCLGISKLCPGPVSFSRSALSITLDASTGEPYHEMVSFSSALWRWDMMQLMYPQHY